MGDDGLLSCHGAGLASLRLSSYVYSRRNCSAKELRQE